MRPAATRRRYSPGRGPRGRPLVHAQGLGTAGQSSPENSRSTGRAQGPQGPPADPQAGPPPSGPPAKGPRGRPGSNEPSRVRNGPVAAEIRPSGAFWRTPRDPHAGPRLGTPGKGSPRAARFQRAVPRAKRTSGTPGRLQNDAWATSPRTPAQEVRGCLPRPLLPWGTLASVSRHPGHTTSSHGALFADEKNQSPPLEMTSRRPGAQGVRAELCRGSVCGYKKPITSPVEKRLAWSFPCAQELQGKSPPSPTTLSVRPVSGHSCHLVGRKGTLRGPRSQTGRPGRPWGPGSPRTPRTPPSSL